jgi:hypothetical protein
VPSDASDMCLIWKSGKIIYETTPDMMFRLLPLVIYPLERGTKDDLPDGGQREKVRDEVGQCVFKAVLSQRNSSASGSLYLWTKGLANSPRTPFS